MTDGEGRLAVLLGSVFGRNGMVSEAGRTVHQHRLGDIISVVSCDDMLDAES